MDGRVKPGHDGKRGGEQGSAEVLVRGAECGFLSAEDVGKSRVHGGNHCGELAAVHLQFHYQADVVQHPRKECLV